MKNRIKILGIAFMLIIGLGACEKTYLEPEIPQSKTETVPDKPEARPKVSREDMITRGAWQITSFQWHNKENNDHFKGYLFYFLPNGSVVAVHQNVKDEGKWAKYNTLFRLNFGPDRPLRELNSNNWFFIRISKNKFVLKGLSPLDHSSQFVEFERV